MKKDLEIDQEIWNLSKLRFFQSESSFWLVKTKILEIFFIISLGASFASHYFEQNQRVTFGALAIAVVLGLSLLARENVFKGFFDGYEQGFRDAGFRRIDYHDEDYGGLASFLSDITEMEERMSKEDWAARDEEIRRGMVNAATLFRRSKK